MQTVHTIAELRAQVVAWKRAGERVAFVPTMGNLHRGHIHLVERARELAPRTVASIFVNPMQFGPSEDFAAYPRTLEADSRQLEAAGLDLLFAPSVAEMYPRPLENMTQVTVPELPAVLCGANRPIIGVATVREPDGLALSSRNGYLSDEQRAIAPTLHATLQATAERWRAGNRDWARLEADAKANLTACGFRPDYVEIRRADDLQRPAPEDVAGLRIFAAAWLGRARLIDNLPI